MKICDSSLQLTLLLGHGLVDGLTLCVELGVVDSFANFLVRRLVGCLTLLLNDRVVPEKKGLGWILFRRNPLKFLLGLAFLFVDGGELCRACVLVDRLVDCFALVVVHSLVLGGTNLINTLEKSIMKRAT